MPWQGVHGRELFRVLDHGIPKPFWLKCYERPGAWQNMFPGEAAYDAVMEP